MIEIIAIVRAAQGAGFIAVIADRNGVRQGANDYCSVTPAMPKFSASEALLYAVFYVYEALLCSQ